MKKFLQGKFATNILKPVIRGVVKQIPFVGTPIVEVVTNMTKEKANPTDAPKHSTKSIVTQVVIAVVILADLYLNKGANIKAVLEQVGVLGLLR